MYNLGKSTTKIITQMSSNLIKLESHTDMHVDHPVIGPISIKKSEKIRIKPKNPRLKCSVRRGPQEEDVEAAIEGLSPEHAALVRFIGDSWNELMRMPIKYINKSKEKSESMLDQRNGTNASEINHSSKETISTSSSSFEVPYVAYVEDDGENSALENFEPFDLDTFWEKRIWDRLMKDI